MGFILNKLKNKIRCWINGKNGCDNCPYNSNGHDYWGCVFGFRK